MMKPNDRLSESLDSVDVNGLTRAADETAQAFEAAGNRIANALQRAASDGELSFSEMAESITRDLARIAVRELITDPLEGVFTQLTSSVLTSSTLSGGQGIGAKSAPVNVTVNVSGVSSVSDFKKSETQLAAGLARALSQGRKLT